MEQETVYDVIITGAGPAGIAAAIWCVRLGLHTLLLEKNAEIGGQLHEIHNPIIDYPGIMAKNGAELYQLFKQHSENLSIELITNAPVNHLTITGSIVVVESNLHTYKTKRIILASGTKERRLHIPGEQEMYDRGENFSSKRDLFKLEGKQVVIVGGGDRALEGVCNLAKVAQSVMLVHRGNQFRARKEFLNQIPHFTNVSIRTETILTAINGKDRIDSVIIKNLNNDHVELINTEAVLIRIGRVPIDTYVPSNIERNSEGMITVDSDGRTSNEQIFAIGDLINEPAYSSISTSVGQAMRAAKAIFHDLSARKE